MHNQNLQTSRVVSGEKTRVETVIGRRTRTRWLPVIGIALASGGLGISLLLSLLIGLDLISVPWNAVVLPRIALFGLLPLSLTGLVVSIVSCVYCRDTTSIIGIVLGFLATLASLLAFLVIIGTALAGHPL